MFLDESSLWPKGDFVMTHLIVRTRYLEEHPEVVENLIRAHVDDDDINENQAKRGAAQPPIEKLTTTALPDRVIDGAWQNLRITYYPIASSLSKSADDAFELGFLGSDKPDSGNIYGALDLLNKVLREKNLPEAMGTRDEPRAPAEDTFIDRRGLRGGAPLCPTAAVVSQRRLQTVHDDPS